MLNFTRELERDALVNNLGTGTVAFCSALLRGLDLGHFREASMADLYLSVFCKQRGIPMVAIARPDDWLQEQEAPGNSLYQEFRQSDDRQSVLLRSHRPWGYAAIQAAVAATVQRSGDGQLQQRLAGMIPELHPCLR